ncbi:MAG: TetR/AcrR family transcriptional regulator C-terminal domain-containing protein [Acetobacterium woodii]|nr:TetR/AcrR family transcriptional regulator C-terminal domain-containing protein [Acetobacterium woodii]
MNTTLSATAKITRQNLIDSFWLLYCQKRIEKITVKEICELAGYNRSTFYVYFKDAYEILEEIEEQTITVEDFKKIVIKNLFYGNLFHDHRKKVILKSILEFFEKNKTYLPVLLGENGDPHFRQKVLKKLTPTVLSMYKKLTPQELLEVSYLMEYQSAAMLSTIAKWYANDKDLPTEQFLELLLAATTNGIQIELSKYRR